MTNVDFPPQRLPRCSGLIPRCGGQPRLPSSRRTAVAGTGHRLGSGSDRREGGFPMPSHPRPGGDGRRGRQTACKPGSVQDPPRRPGPPIGSLDDHSSGTSVAGRLARPTRAATRTRRLEPVARFRAAPIRSCSRWGLPCHPRCRGRGALLPHPFTLARPAGRAVCSLWHFPWGRPRRALPGTVSPWSPDFPRRSRTAVIRPSGGVCIGPAPPVRKELLRRPAVD